MYDEASDTEVVVVTAQRMFKWSASPVRACEMGAARRGRERGLSSACTWGPRVREFLGTVRGLGDEIPIVMVRPKMRLKQVAIERSKLVGLGEPNPPRPSATCSLAFTPRSERSLSGPFFTLRCESMFVIHCILAYFEWASRSPMTVSGLAAGQSWTLHSKHLPS